MKINPIATHEAKKLTKTTKVQNTQNTTNPINSASSLIIPNDYSKISFEGKKSISDMHYMRQMQKDFTPEAEIMYEKAQDYAKKNRIKRN